MGYPATLRDQRVQSRRCQSNLIPLERPILEPRLRPRATYDDGSAINPLSSESRLPAVSQIRNGFVPTRQSPRLLGTIFYVERQKSPKIILVGVLAPRMSRPFALRLFVSPSVAEEDARERTLGKSGEEVRRAGEEFSRGL